MLQKIHTIMTYEISILQLVVVMIAATILSLAVLSGLDRIRSTGTRALLTEVHIQKFEAEKSRYGF